jgi:hypothetical protein
MYDEDALRISQTRQRHRAPSGQSGSCAIIPQGLRCERSPTQSASSVLHGSRGRQVMRLGSELDPRVMGQRRGVILLAIVRDERHWRIRRPEKLAGRCHPGAGQAERSRARIAHVPTVKSADRERRPRAPTASADRERRSGTRRWASLAGQAWSLGPGADYERRWCAATPEQ